MQEAKICTETLAPCNQTVPRHVQYEYNLHTHTLSKTSDLTKLSRTVCCAAVLTNYSLCLESPAESHCS
jgi:hypothetical protein